MPKKLLYFILTYPSITFNHALYQVIPTYIHLRVSVTYVQDYEHHIFLLEEKNIK